MAKHRPIAAQEREIELEIDGKRHTGWWSVAGKARLVTVGYGGRSKTTHAGGHTPEQMARVLLRELVAEADARRGRGEQ